jgi:hypothetical protein
MKKKNLHGREKKDICERAFKAEFSFIETKIIIFGDVQRMSYL